MKKWIMLFTRGVNLENRLQVILYILLATEFSLSTLTLW